MPLVDLTAADPFALEGVRDSFRRYSEPLLRAVAARLIRPRKQWPADELRERLIEALGDTVLIDRTLKTLPPAARQLLRLVGMSRQPRWRVRALVDLLNALGRDEGVGPIHELLETGLMFPELPAKGPLLTSFAVWLQNAAVAPLAVAALPLAAGRARGEDLGLVILPHEILAAPTPQETDGLEWPLRLAVFWQLVLEGPLRRTQQGGYFKRDLDRLRIHPLLSVPPAEAIGPIPDPGLLAASLAQAEGVAVTDADQTSAGKLPAYWSDGLGPTLVSMWAALVTVDDWDALNGWTGELPDRQSLAVTTVLTLAVLATVPEGAWVRAADAGDWLDKAPEATPGVGAAFLLGLAHQLRLVQITRQREEWWVRLSAVGRSLAEGEKKLPPEQPPVAQTLLVQPNLEIVLFRQGLTPGLLARLSHVAEWKALGLACTLTLTAESVYRGLESGETLADIVALLERHGTRTLSETVLGSLRSWSSKRERVSVFPSALLLEFRNVTDLDRALREGLVEHRITDRIGLIASDDRIAYEQFRLVGSRDYLAAEEHCAEVGDDGLTLVINEHKSDLLLESELRRFAEATSPLGADDRTRYRMTPATFRTAQRQGLDVKALDAWFLRRTGEPLSATAKLLLSGEDAPPLMLEKLVALRVPNEEMADGIVAWPETRGLIVERLAPTLLAVPVDAVEQLRVKLAELGVRVVDR